MFKKINALVVVIISLFSIGFSSNINGEIIAVPKPINQIFTDTTLANIMKTTLNKASVSDVITQAELDSVTSLVASDTSITSVNGVEYLNNLTSLDVSGTSIVDVTPISKLVKLEFVNVEQNRGLQDISSFSTLTKLISIRGSYTGIQDLSALSAATNLESVVFFDSKVNDVSMFRNSTKLKTLYTVAIPGLKSVEAIKDLPLLNNVNFRYAQLYDLSVFSNGFNAITSIQLSNQVIYSDSGLRVDRNGNGKLTNILKNVDNSIIIPKDNGAGEAVSDNGTYDAQNNEISWTGLDQSKQQVEYYFTETVVINGVSTAYNGTVVLNVEQPISISFDTNGGNNLESYDAYKNDLIVQPTKPIKAGFVFDGWYKDVELKSPWNFNLDKINGDTTLYAKWTTASSEQYTVNFNSNGGTTIQSYTDVTKNSLIKEPTKPTKKGYKFVAWYSDAEFITSWNFNEDRVNSNTTLYAKWKKDSLNISGNDNLPKTGSTQAYFILISSVLTLSLFAGYKIIRKNY